jgi:hypothetical protein
MPLSKALRPAAVTWLRYLLLAVPIVLVHNVAHEATHYVLALAFGERVEAFRFLTNGLGSSQVVYATPVPDRTGLHWLLVAWVPSVLTTSIGYLVYMTRRRLRRTRLLSLATLYAGFFFLLLDPLYLSVLSMLVGGDVEAAAAVRWSPWPVRLVAVGILTFNWRLMRRWLREQRTQERARELACP